MAKKKKPEELEDDQLQDNQEPGDNEGLRLGPQVVGDVEIREAHMSGASVTYAFLHMAQKGVVNKEKTDDKRIVHEDLRAAFKKLNHHLALICEQVPLPPGTDIDDIADYNPNEHKQKDLEYKMSRFYVNGIKMNNAGEQASVILFGNRILSNDKVMELKTPKVNLIDYDYRFLNELVAAVDGVLLEVDEYRKGKVAPQFVQAEIGFDRKPEEEVLEETN